MKEKNLLIEFLVDVGLSRYEAEAYVALVREGGLSAVEVARTLGIPKPRIYDVLKNLSRLGFLYVQEGSPVIYVPAPLEEALDSVLARQRKEMDKKNAAVEELINLMGPLYGKASLLENICLNIRDRRNVLREIRRMIPSAKRVSVVVPTEPLSWLNKGFLKKDFCDKKLRVIAAKEGKCFDGMEKKVVSVTKSLGLIIVDERECMLLSFDGVDVVGGVLIKNLKIAAGFEQLFDFMWKSV